jgi:hypothetical protein
MLVRQINLVVTRDFAIPDLYTKGTIDDIEEALWIGATIQQGIQVRRSNDEVRQITELKDAEILRIQTTYNEKLTRLLTDIRMVTVEKEQAAIQHERGLKEARDMERVSLGREWDEKMRLLRKDHEALVGRCAALESERRVVEESRNKEIQDAVQRTEAIMEKLVQAKEQQLHKLEAMYGRLNDAMTKQTGEITKLSSVLGKRQANIKVKGSDYENVFGEKLRGHYGLCRGFELKETRLGAGHEMDFSMSLEGHVIMWEVKNYGSVVPKAEVDKFLRDLKENPQAKIGVMISRSTDIYGKNLSGGILTEFDDGVMMIYINRFEEFCGDDEGRIFQILMSLFRVWWEYHREGGQMFDREEIIREVERAVEDLSKRRTEWRRHKAHLDEIGRWVTDLLDESEIRLDRVLKKARMTCSDDGKNGDEVEIPDGIFRESGEEKERTWVKSIMKVCESGGEIEVRELVDLLCTHHKLSKDTIRSNIMAIVRDTAVVKKGVVKYIKGISKIVPKCQIRV